MIGMEWKVIWAATVDGNSILRDSGGRSKLLSFFKALNFKKSHHFLVARHVGWHRSRSTEP
jgi:hypothetical protein